MMRKWSRQLRYLAAALSLELFVTLTGSSLPREGQRSRAPSQSLWQRMERELHAGSLQDALVAVEVTVSSADGAVKRTQRGNGLVLRCDGFVLVPTSLFNRDLSVAGNVEEAAAIQVAVITRPGSPGEMRSTAHKPRHVRSGLGFCVVKIDDWHGTSIGVESPEGMPAGDRLQVYWCEWTGANSRWSGLRNVSTAAGGAADEGEDGVRHGLRSFGQPILRVPPGAMVCGPSGRAIGMAVGGSSEKGTTEFVGFDALHLATNCVVAETRRVSSEVDGTGEPIRPEGRAIEMVKIPGGPVILPASVKQSQPDLEGASYACVAPFEIDRTEVTNAQYLVFWNGLPAERRRELSFQNRYWPANWSKQRAPFPAEITDFPVTGVPLTGASAYAHSLGKRLPTPYEWSLAALGPQGAVRPPDWITSLVRDRQQVWARASAVHLEYRDTMLALNRNNRVEDLYQLPWIANGIEMIDASAWSKRTLELLAAPVRRQYADPDYLSAVGTRVVDESPFGVMDMLLNAPELVVSSPGLPTRGGERHMEVHFPPAVLPNNSQFVPRKLELIAAREEFNPYPVLSRLYRRLINSPSTPDLLAWSNIAEMQRILAPPGDWEVRMTSLQPTSYSGKPRGVGLSTLGRPLGLKLWEELPRSFRQEIGLHVPIDEVERRIPTGPSLYYVTIGGFRCARGG